MKFGFDSIGNATIIAYDQKPVLVTDPWLQGSAYFGSWILSHQIPDEQRAAALACDYVWFSHGHPDHLNPDSVSLFKGKKILLPDHVGNRIQRDLSIDGYDVTILRDRVWTRLSERIRVLCLADVGQDAILLIDMDGSLLVNTNDCGENGWDDFIRSQTIRYKQNFLFRLSGYGDADMLNFYDESGRFLEPLPMKRRPFGPEIARTTESLGCQFFVPSSSMHRYNRTDSLWANAMAPTLLDYSNGFTSELCQVLPAFIRFDLDAMAYLELNPAESSVPVTTPEENGDNWSDVLEKEDIISAEKYFKAIECLGDTMGFIRLRVGGKEHVIELNSEHAKVGVTFEVPRKSLVTSIKYEIFDDILIGNFMKTTLHGNWPSVSLHPWFAGYVGKYADNGRAKSRKEVEAYLMAYEARCPAFYWKRREARAKDWLKRSAGENSPLTNFAKTVYRGFRRLRYGH